MATEGSVTFPVPQFDFPASELGNTPISVTFKEVSPPPSSANLLDQQVWNDLDQFYSENQQKIENSLILSRDGTDDGNHVVDALGGLLESASLVLEGLVALGNVHPVLGVAIFAFHGIVKLDLARRDNDRKVLAVVLQMQNMMGAMFQLRELRATSLSQARNHTEKGALEILVENIARDITVCRGNLIYYSKRKFVSKLVRSKSYEKMLADHIQVFTLRRSELQLTIASYIAAGLNAMSVSMIDVQSRLNSIDENLGGTIQDILRRLSTKQELSMLEFVDRNGGPQRCVDSGELLAELLVGAGENVSTGKAGESSLIVWRNSLKEELTQELSAELQKHQARFEKLLNIQNNNMKRISEQLENQGQSMHNHGSKLDRILNNLNTVMVYEQGRFRRKTVKLKDPEIQEVWERMDLDRRSVKAKHFVLTFRDHILTGYSIPPTPHSRPSEIQDVNASTPSTLLFSANAAIPFGETITGVRRDPDTESNRWLLEYIDVSYVRPIVEAIDEDVSGFISVQEASKFALARPKELSLLHWMAYWAAGWHMTLANYQWHIHKTLLEMYSICPSILMANKVYVDNYLAHTAFRRVECLIRSLRPLPTQIFEDDKLRDVATPIANADMQRLNFNLREFSFVLDSPSDVAAVGGEARIETWILPLLLLILNRHLAVLKLGSKIVLDNLELDVHINTLESIFLAFDERMHGLQGKFLHMDRDIESQFEKFAHGMFLTSFKKQEDEPIGNITLTQSGTFIHDLDVGESKPQGPPWDLSVLCKPQGPTLTFDQREAEISAPSKNGMKVNALEGSWVCFRTLNEVSSKTNYPPGIVQLNISSVSGNKIKGLGTSSFAIVDIVGRVDLCRSPNTVVLKLVSTGYAPIVLQGQYCSEKDIITGLWTWKETNSQISSPVLTSTPLSAANHQDVEERLEASKLNEKATTAVPAFSSDADENNIITDNFETISGSSVETTPDEGSQKNACIPLLAASEGIPIEKKSRGTDSDEAEQSEVSETIERQDDTNIPVLPTERLSLEEEIEDMEFNITIDEKSSEGTFWLRRTPPDATRFRYFLDEHPLEMECSSTTWSISRRRWVFAISAVHEEVLRQMGSLKLFRKRLAERRQWLDTSLRFRMSDYVSFSQTDLDKWFKLKQRVPPQNGRLYESIVSYMSSRFAFTVGGDLQYCDKCKCLAISVHYRCLVCISDDMKSQIILCHDCHDRPSDTTEKKFVHKLSHSLIRSTRLLHVAELQELIERERSWDVKLKKRFRRLETDKKNEENKLQETVDLLGRAVDEPPPKCGCCNKEVNLPCYVCVPCALFFMCLECQNNRIPLMKDNAMFGHHTSDHHLHLIRDSTAETKTQSDYERLEEQLVAIESRFRQELAAGLSTLEKNINLRLGIQPTLVSAVVAKVVKEEPAGSMYHISDMGGDSHPRYPVTEEDNNFDKVGSAAPGLSSVGTSASQEELTVPALDLKVKELIHKQSILESRISENIDGKGKPVHKIDGHGTNVEDRLAALEDKVGVLISLLQNFVQHPERRTGD